MVNPAIDLIAIAKAQGAQGEAGIENATELAAALERGEKAVRAGAVYIIEARIDVGAPGERGQSHTSGRKD